MRNYLFIFIIVFLGVSCDEAPEISEELIGEWIYERELFLKDGSFSTVDDLSGLINFNEDKTGNWNPSNPLFLSFFYELEWKVDESKDKITIIKELVSEFTVSVPTTRDYDLKRTDENTFTFTYLLESLDEVTNTVEVIEFENIILTRKI